MIRSFKGITPTIPASCYVDYSAQIIGDVVLGEHASVWMSAVLRGDVYAIRVGAHANIQDCSVLHGMKDTYGVTVGEYVTVGHSVTLHGCVIDHCRGHANSRARRGRTRLALDGLSRKVPPQTRESRRRYDHALRHKLSGIHGRIFAGTIV